MNNAILSCTGLDKPEGSVAREVAIRMANTAGSEIICPVLLNRSLARYKKVLAENLLIVVDGCSTRCASKLAESLDLKIDRKVLIADALKSSGLTLESTLNLGANGLALAKTVVDGLMQSLTAPAVSVTPGASSLGEFPPPGEYLIVTHDKFEFRIPAVDYWFNENDVWVRPLGDVVRVGISDYMQQSLTDINFVDPPAIGLAVEQFGELGTLESSKAVFEVVAPVAGTVVAVNPEVVSNPTLINEDPYGKGWIVELKLGNWPEDQELLLNPDAYAKTVKHKAEEA
ncbi:MAG: putative zinc-binding protein [Acidobacteriaceae bacterium]